MILSLNLNMRSTKIGYFQQIPANHKKVLERECYQHSSFNISSCSALKQNKGIRIPDLSAKKLIDAGFKFKYGPEEMLDDTVQCCKEKVTCEVAVFPFYVRTVIHIPYNKAMLVRATNRDLISSGIGLLFTIETNVCSSITFFVCIKLIINNMCYVGCCKVVSYLL